MTLLLRAETALSEAKRIYARSADLLALAQLGQDLARTIRDLDQLTGSTSSEAGAARRQALESWHSAILDSKPR